MTWHEMPCLKSDGLAVFSQTPEQRVMLGEQWFDTTHAPIWMRKRMSGTDVLVSDQELLRHLCEQERVTGNRVVVIYGAAGSGKSELVTWLNQSLLHATPQRPVVRIARTDLDTLGILNQMHHLLTGRFFAETTLRRWDEMRAKPRTLSKLLVLRALEKQYASDDIINQLFFRILDAVEPVVERILARDTKQTARDILDHDYMERLLTQGALPVRLDIAAFRQHLFDVFSELMLEHLSIRDTLRALSTHFKALGQRPVLLFDDLVQSVNVFAADFLDYFITLDEGNWDVLFGITPGSLDTDTRGRELVRRIENLDTIDDRVDKLWLSDERGLESFFLNEANVAEFAANYLDAFRHLNRVECVKCTHLAACTSLKGKDSHLLAPLNEVAVIRVFRGLPTYKGKVRAFVRALHHIMEGCVDGERPDIRLPQIASSNLYVESENTSVRDLVKYYGYEDLTSDDYFRLMAFFDVPVSDSMPYCSTLEQSMPPISGEDIRIEGNLATDQTVFAVREWLEGKVTNRELLQDLRKGVSSWLRTAHPPVATGVFHHPYVARPHGILRDNLVERDVSPPVVLEGVDASAGIQVSRSIGPLAFEFVRLRNRSPAVRKAALTAIANDPRATAILWQSQAWNQQRQSMLEVQIGLPLAKVAFAAFVLRWFVNGPSHLIPPEFSVAHVETLASLHHVVRLFVPGLPSSTCLLIDQWFDDFFKLRDNVYDYKRIALHMQDSDFSSELATLAQLPEHGVDEVFRLGGVPLLNTLGQLRQRAIQVLSALATYDSNAMMRLSGKERELMGRLQRGEHIPLSDLSVDHLREFSEKMPDMFKGLHLSYEQAADHTFVRR